MVLTKRFLLLMRKNNVSIIWLAKELEISVWELIEAINGNGTISYDNSKQLLSMFGADDMSKVIDWEGMHVSCPI